MSSCPAGMITIHEVQLLWHLLPLVARAAQRPDVLRALHQERSTIIVDRANERHGPFLSHACASVSAVQTNAPKKGQPRSLRPLYITTTTTTASNASNGVSHTNLSILALVANTSP